MINDSKKIIQTGINVQLYAVTVQGLGTVCDLMVSSANQL